MLNMFLKSGNWPATPGEIIHCDVPYAMDSDDRDYLIDLKYSFQLYGQTLFGHRISTFAPNSFNTRPVAQSVASQYPSGSQVNVYYNPSDPSQTCLESAKGTSPKLFRAIKILWATVSILLLIIVTLFRHPEVRALIF